MTTAMNRPTAECGHAGHCGGKLKQARDDGREFCCNPAGHRTPHPGIGRCTKHGGSTGSHVRAAQEQQALQDAHRLGLTVETTAVASLQDALNRAQADVIVLGAQVALLEPDSWIERETLAGGGSRREISPLLRAYWQCLDRLATVSSTCRQRGIEAEAVSVVARHGSEVVELLRRVLLGLGLQPSDQRVVEVVTRELQALEGGPE